MFGRAKALVIDTVNGFIADDVLTRAAGIAYFTLFSIGPLAVIAIAVAGFVFGEEAARGSLAAQLDGLLGPRAAAAVQDMIRGTATSGSSLLATAISLGTLLLTASGAFGALQSSLNAIWKTQARTSGTFSRLVKAKLAALGLVATTGFLLLTSLIASAALSALRDWISGLFPGVQLVLQAVNFLLSFGIITALFAAIYKVLPDRQIAWRDVAVGAMVTALLFTVGKTAIGLYLGNSSVASAFGAAGALAVVLVWIYYSAVIFLAGAEFTRAWAGMTGSRTDAPVPDRRPDAAA